MSLDLGNMMIQPDLEKLQVSQQFKNNFFRVGSDWLNPNQPIFIRLIWFGFGGGNWKLQLTKIKDFVLAQQRVIKWFEEREIWLEWYGYHVFKSLH